ncbi:hypothetical protein PCI56_03375 [Plesiomonas shigelloides subsp. oncorhynchi]|nr:hypothetical protein [Plesiomonas shigelloides]
MIDDEAEHSSEVEVAKRLRPSAANLCPLAGCISDKLGTLECLCVAAPHFINRYFHDGIDSQPPERLQSCSINMMTCMQIF